jgi:1-acyl-sn-glycerol-3-phosphate acyltransferase
MGKDRFWKLLQGSRFVKKLVYAAIGVVSYPGLAVFNRLRFSGTEHLKGLPPSNVLFVSNHRTYFTDVITFLHIFSAVRWGKTGRLGLPFYILNPYVGVVYVAAEETMRAGWIQRIFQLAGALMVKRTWRTEGRETRRGLDVEDTRKITRALEKNWVITFPQGTTRPFAPGRKGTAHIILAARPVVIPIVIRGFRRAFNKWGLKLRKRGTRLSVTFKPPLEFKGDESVDAVLERVMDAIEQSEKFRLGSASPTPAAGH